MAASEGIKVALRALEEESGWALNLAECFVAAAGDQGRAEPPWINQFHLVVSRLAERVEVLSQAIYLGPETLAEQHSGDPLAGGGSPI
jgi:hypothetical protein